MELEYHDMYPEYISKNVYSHRLSVGITISILLAIASTIVIVIVLRVCDPYMILLYSILFVFTPMMVIVYFTSKHLAKQAFDRAKKFVEVILIVAEKLGTRKVELLEFIPPPYIAILKYGKYYIVIRYLGLSELYISILDPLKTKSIEGYIAIYLVKNREILAHEDIDSHRLNIYKALVALAEPLEDQYVEGSFYLYEIFLPKLDAEDIVEYIKKIFDKIEHMRNLYK